MSTESDNAPVKQRRLPAPERRGRILEAALAVFSERGYAAAMGEVATEAGVTRTVLYYYFPAKQDLFLAVLDSLLTELLRYVAPAAAREGSLEERSRHVLRAVIEFVQANPRSWRIVFAPQEDTAPEVAELLGKMEAMAKDAALMLFADEITDMGVDLDSPRMRIMAEVAVGAGVQVMRWWSAHPEVSADEVEDAVFELAWHGLQGLTRQPSKN